MANRFYRFYGVWLQLPAVMATRTIETGTTGAYYAYQSVNVVQCPFTCVHYVNWLFFPHMLVGFLFATYLLGIFLAVITALILKGIFFKERALL
jgi:Fe2+ transport system protein B